MSTLLARGQALLAAKGKAAAGVAVEYSRAFLAEKRPLTVWVARAVKAEQPAAVGAEAVRLVTHDREYLIAAADLPFPFGPPEPGDRIAETVGGVAEVYEVVPQKGPLPAWEYADSAQTIYRVRTRRERHAVPGGFTP